jgi:hypothetical protein
MSNVDRRLATRTRQARQQVESPLQGATPGTNGYGKGVNGGARPHRWRTQSGVSGDASERRSCRLDANTQLALPLVDPLEPRILPQDGRVWFTTERFVQSGARGRWRVWPHLLRDIDDVLNQRHDPNTYFSQATYDLPQRLLIHIAWITHSHVDLDCYNEPEWEGCTPDDIVREIVWHCDDLGIPPPSIILSSGRGFYCKWFWSQPIPRPEAARAGEVNRALCRAFERFGADRQSVDVTRILRISGTINSKNGQRVRIVWFNGSPDAPVTYDFDAFARDIVPASSGEEPPVVTFGPGMSVPPGTGHNSRRTILRFNVAHWNWGVVEDLRTLAQLRWPGSGIVHEGQRDLFGHFAACALAHVVLPTRLPDEVVAICREFLPSGFIANELRRQCGTVVRKARDAANGVKVEFQGTRWDPRYAYRKTTIIEKLRIEPHEERHMTRLISDGEKHRRREERRRAAGMVERSEYEARSAARGAQAATMRAQGMTLRAIAAEIGISLAQVQRLLRERDIA